MRQRRSQSSARGLVLAVVAVVLGLGLVFGLSVASGRGDVKLKGLGDKEFRVGDANSKAKAITKDGPLLFADASGGDTRDIYLQHVGDKWYAIAAGPRDCTLVWTGSSFSEPCTKKTFPPDGTGRTRYKTRVDNNAVYVDFTTTVP